MGFKAMTEDFLFVLLMAYCVLNKANCQFAGRRFNIATTNLRRPIHTAHDHLRGQGGLPSFLSGDFNTRAPVNFRGTHPNRSHFNISQFIRSHGVHLQNNGQSQRLQRGNIHSTLNEPHIVSLHRQNSFPNRIGYTTVSNRVRSNEQSRTFSPVAVQSRQTVQNARLQHRSRGIGTEARRNNPNKIDIQGIPPVREAAVSGRQISGNRHLPLLQSLSDGQVASYNIQTTQNAPGRTSWSSGSVSASGPHSVSKPLQAQVLHNLHRSVHQQTPTISGSSVLQTRLAGNRIQPHHQFQGEQNEAFQYRTSISRAPTSNQHVSWNNRPQFSGSPISSLTLPFEPLSLRYQGLKNSNKVKQNSRSSDIAMNLNERNPQRNVNAESHQTDSHVRGDSRQQTGIQFVGGTLQQTGTQYRDGSAQFRPQFNNIRRHPQNFDITMHRQGHLFPQRNVQTTARSLHEVLGISTKGLQDAVRSSIPEVTKTRNRNQNSNNAQVVRNQSRGHRTGTQNGSQSSRNTNEQSQAKANLIADISRTLSLADRLKLFGEELGDNWLTTDTKSNNANDRPVPPNSLSTATGRMDSDTADSEADDTEDRLATPYDSRGISFPGQSANVYIVSRNGYNDEDDDDDT